ncbi:hypothetical protein RND81_04G137900 [Saponaria officinalis]|uniref:Uncharacterized protein n=1 Tax=Saponaria officinalis TaxID=3572 RepID=A0AAW1LLR4_SAPOF
MHHHFTWMMNQDSVFLVNISISIVFSYEVSSSQESSLFISGTVSCLRSSPSETSAYRNPVSYFHQFVLVIPTPVFLSDSFCGSCLRTSVISYFDYKKKITPYFKSYMHVMPFA